MVNVIVAFSKPEDARNIKNILTRSGFSVVAVCNSGASVLAQAEGLSDGLIVCGYRLKDMLYAGLHENLAPGFSLLVVSSPNRWDSHMPEDVVCLPMPLKVHDLVSTVEMMSQALTRSRKRRQQQPRQRDEGEKKTNWPGEKAAHGKEWDERGGGPPVYSKMQHGQRDKFN